MTLAETAELLALCAAFDNRHVEEASVEAWHSVLAPYPLPDCRDAVKAYYAEQSERVMPAHIKALVRKIRAERLDRHPVPAPPADLSPVEHAAWLRDARRRIADGWVPEQLPELEPIALPDIFPSPPRLPQSP